MKEQVKLMLKGLSEETGAPFTKEVHTLDEVKSCGNYTVIGRNVSTANGLPAISGKKHNCFCCEAKLTVTCCYPESESQSDSAYGQCLTICDRETGEANTYTRSIAPTKNKGKWSAWNRQHRPHIAKQRYSRKVLEHDRKDRQGSASCHVCRRDIECKHKRT